MCFKMEVVQFCFTCISMQTLYQHTSTEYETFALSNVANNLDYAIKIRFVIKDLLGISVTDKKF